LEHEFYVYQKLGRGTGISCAHWFGVESGFNVMAMSRLGQSLEDLFVRRKSLFSDNAVLQLASQLVRTYSVVLKSHPLIVMSRSAASNSSPPVTMFTGI
jgi:hypothetical protein